jgi:esterase/lipase superfamily enzyme
VSSLAQLSSIYRRLASDDNPSPPLGQVICCAPDIDHDAFLEHAVEGFFNETATTEIYTNRDDAALKTSTFLYKWKRLGAFDAQDMTAQGIELMLEQDRVSYVSVMNARDFDKGKGHSYFRNSPDVSSDIILMLGEHLPPAGRGLVREAGDPVWKFPDDYEERIVRIRDSIWDAR